MRTPELKWIVGTLALIILPWAFFYSRARSGGYETELQLLQAEYLSNCFPAFGFPTWTPFSGLGRGIFGDVGGLSPGLFLFGFVNDRLTALFIYFLVLITVGSLGLYGWARYEGLSRPAASAGALAIGLSMPVGATYMSGMLDRCTIVAWLPWVCWAVASVVDKPGGRATVLLSLALAPMLLSARLCHVALIAFILISIASLLAQRRLLSVARLHRTLFSLLGAGLISVSLCSTYIVPTLEMASQSLRVNMNVAADTGAPPNLWRHIITPDFIYAGISCQSAPFIGAVAGCMAILGLTSAWQQRAVIVSASMVVVGIVAGAGSRSSIYQTMIQPVFTFVRGPEYFLFIVITGAAMLAAYGVDAVIATRKRRRLAVATSMVALIFIVSSISFARRSIAFNEIYARPWTERQAGDFSRYESTSNSALRAGIAVACLTGAIVSNGAGILLLIICAELTAFWHRVIPAPVKYFSDDDAQELERIIGGRSPFPGGRPAVRVLPILSDWRTINPQVTLSRLGWESPLIDFTLFTQEHRLAISQMYDEKYMRGERVANAVQWESLILVPSKISADQLSPDGIANMGVQFLVSDHELHSPRWHYLAKLASGLSVYRVTDCRPRFEWITSIDDATDGEVPMRDVQWFHDGLLLQLHGIGGDLCARYIWSPSWQAIVDGEPLIQGPTATSSGFISVRVPRGSRVLRLLFKPPSLLISRICTAYGILFALLLWIRNTNYHPGIESMHSDR